MSGPSGNVPDVIVLRRRITAGEVLGPSVYSTGRILDGNPAINPGVSTSVSTPDEARHAVEDQYHAGHTNAGWLSLVTFRDEMAALKLYKLLSMQG